MTEQPLAPPPTAPEPEPQAERSPARDPQRPRKPWWAVVA